MPNLAALVLAVLVAGPVNAQTDLNERTFWESVRDSTDPAELEAYLDAYPNGTFAPLARIRLSTLKDETRASSAEEDTSGTEREQSRATEAATSAPLAGAQGGHRPKIVADRGTLGIEAKAAAGGAGVEITAVRPGRPASSGSLRTGDIIQKIGGEPVLTETSLQEQVAVKAPGEEVQVEVRRDGRALTVTVRVGSYAEHLLALAEEGDADAMMLVGEHLSDGAIFEKDAALAVVWFGRARETWQKRTDLTPNACDRLAANRIDRGKVSEGVPFEKMQADEAIEACKAALGASPETARFQYQLGRAYQKAENYTEALNAYRRAAEQGYAAAIGDLGLMYRNSWGVTNDDGEALRWFREAADQGYPHGMYMVGEMYLTGRGVAKDEAEAARWYARAEEEGHPWGPFALGSLYATGRGVAEDDEAAVRWFTKGAEQGHAGAMHALAGMYLRGEGVAQNDARALHWYRQAAEAGHSSAPFLVGSMYEAGRGVPRDHGEASRWYRLGAERGDENAMYSLGLNLASGRGGERNEAEADRLFAVAAERGHLGALYTLGVGEADPQKAAELIFQTLQSGFEFAKQQMLSDTPRHLGVEFRREMQRLLKEAGVYDGPIDGDFGPGTRRAIEALASQATAQN